MPNTNLTHQLVAREAAAILAEEAPFISNINMARKDEYGKESNGYKPGDTVRVKVPSVGSVFTGSQFAGGGAGQDNTELAINLQLNTQRHVALQFGAKEKLLDLTDFKERILRPQIRVLSSVVEADLLAQAIQATPNLVGTAGSIPTTMKTYAQARARMEGFLAPPSDRTCLYSSDANVELVDASKALFNAKAQIERGFLRGSIGEAQNAMFFEHQSVASITNGNKVAAVTVSGAGQTGSNLLVGGVAASDTFKKGQVFTIAGVLAIHPLTGTPYSYLQQFVVTSDVTSAGTTVSVPIFPALNTTAPNRTVSALPANAAALTFVGAASTAYRQNLMFQKDAFTTAFAPLPVLASCEGYTATLPNGLSVRVMTFGDGNNDYERTRIDVLYGFAAIRPLHAARITE